MTPPCQLVLKIKEKIFLDRKMNLREVNIKSGRLVVFIRRDSA
jgi:hypothetical protein